MEPGIWIILGLFIATVGSMLFSVGALSLRSLSQSKLSEALKEKNRESRISIIIENQEKLTLTCALFRNVLNVSITLLLLALFSTFQSVRLGFLDNLLVFLIAIIIFSVFSLAIPHAWSKYAGEKFLSHTYPFFAVFAVVVSPFIKIFKFNDHIIRRLAGVPESNPDEEHEEKQEEFLSDLEQHRMEGGVDREEQEMIENVLELSETTAAEIMTPRTDVVALEANSSLETVLQTINAVGHTRVPVYEKNIDNIIGFVYAKDLLAEIGKDQNHFSLKNKLRKAYFVPETKPLRTLLHEFQNQKLHIAVVLDEYGGTAGIITLEDILEELVGEIADEYEPTLPKPVTEIDEYTIEADAKTYIDDLNDQYDLELPEDEDYDTLGGFIFSFLGYIPKTGQKFTYEQLEITVTSAESRKINTVRIKKSPQKQNDN